MIHLHVLKTRQKKEVGDGFQALYVSEEEIDTILDDTHTATEEDQRIQTLIERIAELETEIETKKVDLRPMHLF
jgi:DNA-binding transcriptional MerR regulator